MIGLGCFLPLAIDGDLVGFAGDDLSVLELPALVELPPFAGAVESANFGSGGRARPSLRGSAAPAVIGFMGRAAPWDRNCRLSETRGRNANGT